MNLLKKAGQLSLVALALGVLSCEAEDQVKPKPAPEHTQAGDMIKLGKQLENPYSVENMRLAWANIKSSTSHARVYNFDIEPTDLYVRFYPKNEKELNLLEADSLFLFDYPLDYEILNQGSYYVDSTGNQEGKWYYTSVPIDYTFPNIEYEILEELFLIDEDIDNASSNGRSTLPRQFLHDLEDEALRLTDNWEEAIDAPDAPNARPSKRNPQGHVRVWDTERQQLVGVEGVRVRTRRWFSYGYAWTNEAGYYRIDRGYRRDVHYTVFFENQSGFKIWSTTLDLSKASHHVGKHTRSGINIDMSTNSRAWRFATVNNAAVKYRRYCNQFGIGLPPSNIRIAAVDKVGGGAAPMLRRTWGVFGFTSKSDLLAFFYKANGISLTLNQIAVMIKFALPDIVIKAASSQGTAAVYETTFHEMAHASHYQQAGNANWVKYINYIITYGSYGDGTGNNVGLAALGEAWGYHIGHRLTLEEFSTRGLRTDNSVITWIGFEDFTPLNVGSKDDDLTTFFDSTINPDQRITRWEGWIPAGIMQDIVDNNADALRPGFVDNVSGYSLQNLYQALDKDVVSPQEFRDRLLRENNNMDQEDLENLFEAYYWN